MTLTADRPSLAQRMHQSVYVYDAGQGVVKVGCSVRPGCRRSWIKKTYGLTYAEVEWTAPPHPWADSIERRAHKLLKQYRVPGTELFRCSARVAKAAVLQATKAEDDERGASPEATAARVAAIEAGAKQYDEWRWAERQKKRDAARAIREAEIAARIEAARVAAAEKAAAAEREAKARRDAQDALVAAVLAASYRVRAHIQAADAVIARHPTAAEEAISTWKKIEAAWRGQEAA